MAKTAKAGTSTASKKEVKLSRCTEHMNKVAASIKKNRANIIGMLAWCVILFLSHELAVAAGMSGAMLYSIANNGKLSGRADGNVYMRNGRVRAFRVPALVSNAFTTLQRSIFSQMSSGWNGLTDNQRSTWNESEGFFTSDRFGNQVPVKGKELYVMINSNLTDIGGTLLSFAPVPTDVPGVTSLTPVPNDTLNTFTLTFAPTPTNADVDHLVFATAQKSPGTYRPGKSQYRLIGTIAGGTATGATIYTSYITRFGALIAGRKIFVKLVPIENTTGQAGIGIVSSALVV